MAVYRYTYIFQVTTEPVSRAIAQPHTGGWSESVWSNADPAAYDARWTRWGTKRALLLPKQASIIGFRSQKYEIAGNKLIPGGAESGHCLFPGCATYETDLPQVALAILGTSGVAQNNTSFKLLNIPDIYMKGGEFDPDAGFKTKLTNLFNEWISHPTGMIGRDLTQPLVRVLSITPGVAVGTSVVLLDGVYPGLADGDFLRFNRVTDDLGKTVEGSNRVISRVGASITISGQALALLTQPSGFVRKDIAQYIVLNKFNSGRASIRKVGKPLEGYRARQSNR